MKLELKHLAAYLPYSLKVQDTQHPQLDLTLHPIGGTGMIGISEVIYFEHYKPILRSFYQIRDRINYRGLPLRPINLIEDNLWKEDKVDTEDLPYKIHNAFLEMHFDVFNLIPAGLAIDINTLTAD